MVNVACGTCIAVAVMGAKDAVPFPALFVNVAMAVFSAALCGVYTAVARHWQKPFGRHLLSFWPIAVVTGVLSLVCWIAPRAFFLPPCWKEAPVPAAGLLFALGVCLTCLAVTARGCSLSETLKSAPMYLMLLGLSVLLAVGSAQLLMVQQGDLWRHVLTIGFVWSILAACTQVFTNAALGRVNRVLRG